MKLLARVKERGRHALRLAARAAKHVAVLSGRSLPALGGWSWKARLAGCAGLLVGAAALVVAAAWMFGRPSVSVSLSGGALIRVDTGGIVTQLTGVEATAAGKPVALERGAGGFVPVVKLSQGAAVKVTGAVHTPSWIGWLVGSHASTTATLRTPAAVPSQPVAFASAPGEVKIEFDHPVSIVRYALPKGQPQVTRLRQPSRTAHLRVPANTTAGSLLVSAAPLSWEALPARQSTVTWFAGSEADGRLAVADPAPGSTTAAPNNPISLTFAEPVSEVLGSARPRLSPAVPGSWSEPSANTLVFTPSGLGFGPRTTVTVTFDRPLAVVGGAGATVASASNSYSFTTTPGSMLRLEQILAQLHYLPLTFVPAAGQRVPATFADEVASMSRPLTGHFVWRWDSTPAALKDQWTAGSSNSLVRGALMAFDSDTFPGYDGFQADGESVAELADSPMWQALLKAAAHNQFDPHPYSYVYVSKSLPETLTLWENGSVVLTSRCNTGIPASPTADGTFPIYVRYTFNYMTGFNPDGSYYDDPVYWINYFNGGDAVHLFSRASYGFPQSLGCVELPSSTAEDAFHHLAIGDLVTVAG
jgi:L,D-transpeptidase catalytic domain/Bacterial Ig-like domain